MLFGHLIYDRVSSLGDTSRYLSANVEFSFSVFLDSTRMMDYIGGISGNIFGPLFGSLPFCILVYLSTYLCLIRLNLKRYYFITILILLSMPSYGLWTSVASKECVVASSLLILMTQFINIINYDKVNYLVLLSSYYLVFIFKVQYVPIIFTFHLFLVLYHKFNLKYFCFLIFIPLVLILSFYLVYLNRELIDRMGFIVANHFDPNSSSTRTNFLLIEKYDLFNNAPYGMYIALFGPTITEATQKITHLLSFIESTFIIILVSFLYLYKKCISLHFNKLPLNDVVLPLFILLTFAAVHYPFGIMNPGSAIRYRCSFYPFIIISFFLYNNFKMISYRNLN